MIQLSPFVPLSGLKLGIAVFLASLAGLNTSNAQGAKVGVPGENTPKPGIFLNGPMQWGRLVDVKSSTGVIQNTNGTVNAFYLDTVIQESIGLGVNTLIVSDETKGKSREAIVSLTLDSDPDSGHQSLRIGGIIKNPVGSPTATRSGSLQQVSEVGLSEGVQDRHEQSRIDRRGRTHVAPAVQRGAAQRGDRLELRSSRESEDDRPRHDPALCGSRDGFESAAPAPFQGRFIVKSETAKQIVFQPTIGDIDDGRIEKEIELNLKNPKKYPKPNPQVLPLNSLGFPASLSSVTFNVAVFIPAQYTLKNGVSRILLAKDGTALDTNKSITKFSYNPANPSGPASDGTLGVVRVFRAGSSADPNQGFLGDKSIPAILGTQPVTIDDIAGAASRT